MKIFQNKKAIFPTFSLAFLPVLAVQRFPLFSMEAINHIKEREGKVFLDVPKVFDTVWIDGLLYKLFSELEVEGKMFAMTKALYTDVESFVHFNGVSTGALNE